MTCQVWVSNQWWRKDFEVGARLSWGQVDPRKKGYFLPILGSKSEEACAPSAPSVPAPLSVFEKLRYPYS